MSIEGWLDSDTSCDCEVCQQAQNVTRIAKMLPDAADCEAVLGLLEAYYNQGSELDSWKAMGPEELRRMAELAERRECYAAHEVV